MRRFSLLTALYNRSPKLAISALLCLTQIIPAASLPLLLLGPGASPSFAQENSAPPAKKRTVNRTVPQVTPPSPRILSVQPDDAELADIRILPEPLSPRTRDGISQQAALQENAVLAVALRSYAENGATEALEAFLQSYPDTVWDISLWLNLGKVYRNSGYYSRALTAWETAWAKGRENTEPRIAALTDLALGELIVLNSSVGKKETVAQLLGEAELRGIHGVATEKIAQSRGALWYMNNRPDLSFMCGPYALANVARALGLSGKPQAILEGAASDENGFTLKEILDIAAAHEMPMVAGKRPVGGTISCPSLIHWKLDHYAAVIREENGRYLIKDPTFENEVWVTARVLDEESSGYSLVPGVGLPQGWEAVDENTAGSIHGKGVASYLADGDTNPCDPSVPEKCPGAGMADYTVNSLVVSLAIHDIPIGYKPAVGPAINFLVRYSQREAYHPTSFTYSHLGPKWTFGWLSYITDNPTNASANVNIYEKGGGTRTYKDYNAGTQSYGILRHDGSILVRTSASSYRRDLPDGSQEFYTVTDGATQFPRKVFLTEIRDPHGNAVEITYDSSLRIVALEDAIGQVTTLSYEDTSDTRRITKVTDPFGREATFAYDSSGRLETITDVIGVTSAFTYTTGDFVTSLTTPYGVTSFSKGESGVERWLEVTDPHGEKERVEYRSFPPDIPTSLPAEQIPTGVSIRNQYMSASTFFFSKKAMADWGGNLNYTKAVQYHWLRSAENSTINVAVLDFIKKPLEFPVIYNYPGQPNNYSSGSLNVPSKIARVLEDGTTQLTQFEYSATGRMTKKIDPVGRETVYDYAANGVDLLEVKQKNGSNYETLQEMTYNSQHLPLTITDAAGETTTLTYTSLGQPLTVANAKSETTTLAYITNPAVNGYQQVETITGPVSGAVVTYAYDDLQRPNSVTDSDGYEIETQYDDFDRVLTVTYPDGTYNEVVYSLLHAEWSRDRMGRWSRQWVDANRRVIGTMDPALRFTRYLWCGCGALEALIDPNGNRTTWYTDLQGRVVAKTYADDRGETHSYGVRSGRLLSTTDAKSQRTNFEYFSDNTLKRRYYTDTAGTALSPPTAEVSFTYDSIYRRRATMVDGIGTTTYAYNPITTTPTLGAGRLASIDGPLASDTISYTYNELGRELTRSINGSANTEEAEYDALGRITEVVNNLGTFTYAYVGHTEQLDNVAYPNGQTTEFDYFDNAGDRRLKQIKHLNSSSVLISQFDYTYNAVGNILTWRQEHSDSATPQVYHIGYDAADQLTSAQLMNATTSALLSQKSYSFDPSGNRLSNQADTSVFKGIYNTINQLTSRLAGGKMEFSGTVNEAASVNVQGKPAAVDALGNFVGGADVVSGGNTINITATDVNNNIKSQDYEITVDSAATRTFAYDPNGNTTDDGIRTYEWDAQDRLVAINYTGANPPKRTEFTYDGLSRRVRIIEKEGVTNVSDKRLVWNSFEEAELRDATTNTVEKRYFDEGVQAVGASSPDDKFTYTRDHLGSIRELIDSSGLIRARYLYDPWGKRSAISGDLSADFGFTGHWTHSVSQLLGAPLRFYDPELGHWISRDPILESGGANLYGYVHNDPFNRIDPTGEFSPPVLLVIGIVVVIVILIESLQPPGPLPENPICLPSTLGGPSYFACSISNPPGASGPGPSGPPGGGEPPGPSGGPGGRRPPPPGPFPPQPINYWTLTGLPPPGSSRTRRPLGNEQGDEWKGGSDRDGESGEEWKRRGRNPYRPSRPYRPYSPRGR